MAEVWRSFENIDSGSLLNLTEMAPMLMILFFKFQMIMFRLFSCFMQQLYEAITKKLKKVQVF